MNDEGHTSQPPSKRSIAKMLAGSLTVATLALVLFVLPVEFRFDPTGFGRLVGLDQLAAATEWRELEMPEGGVDIVRFYETPFRTDTIDIPLPGNDGDLEYKLRMREGDSMVYSWRVLEISDPEWFYSEFHGHTEPTPGGVGDVMFYRRETGSTENGSFVAPFEGIHGWYLQNQSENPVVVRLELAGFYELIPDQIPPQ
jgi:hypothetical protein